jgi:hypothetical protein
VSSEPEKVAKAVPLSSAADGSVGSVRAVGRVVRGGGLGW